MTFNLAFSSSGVRFAAHVGVLAYIQDNNIKIKNYSGTSGGAIVASWGANNLPARELMNLTVQFGYPAFIMKPSFGLGGMMDHSYFGELIASYCRPKKNLFIVTFNVLKMQMEIWKGEYYNLSKILSATTCIPGLLKPVVYSNGLHIDGIFARFCPDDLWDEGMTISVKLKSKTKTKLRYPIDFIVHYLEKNTIEFLEGFQKTKEDKKNTIYIQPEVGIINQIDLFAVSPEDHLELFQKGYESAQAAFNQQTAFT